MNKFTYKIKLMHYLSVMLICPVPVLSKAQTPTPGGGKNTSYGWAAWLTPENYNTSSGVRTNSITGSTSVGDFSQSGPSSSINHEAGLDLLFLK